MLGVHLIGLSQLYLNIIQLLLNTSTVTNLVAPTVRTDGNDEVLAHGGVTFNLVKQRTGDGRGTQWALRIAKGGR